MERNWKHRHDPDYGRFGTIHEGANARGKAADGSSKGAALAVKLPRPPLSDLIDHIDHMVKVAGVDHVGLGSDFDGIDCSPEGIDSAADLPKITEALYHRGYKAADLRKFWAET